jgi:hypothetical protein
VTPTATSATFDSQLCFYHYNLGCQARNCQPPCRWQGNE